MGGVDTSGLMLRSHSVHRKTRRRHITVYHYFLDISVTNSFIIHQESCGKHQQKQRARQEFQEDPCAHLLGASLTSGCPPTPSFNQSLPPQTAAKDSLRQLQPPKEVQNENAVAI